jgi:two-component system response regulator FixJ
MSQSGSRPRVTIVVDDGPLLNALAFSLEAEGWEAAAFRTPAELVDRLPPSHCLLVDHNLPGMDGLALISLLRERGVTAPAVIIAGKPDRAFRRRAAEAGIEIVDKPLVGDELKLRISAALEGQA